MLIYKFKPRKGTLAHRLGRWVEMIIRLALILCIPIVPAVAAVIFWYLLLYRNGIHFHEEVREILVGGWMQICIILYGLFTGGLFTIVIAQYVSIRMAVKEGRFKDFMTLVDEEVSPLFHGVVTVLALVLLAGFMGAPYPNPIEGAILIGGATYIFGFLCFVVIEVDDPCYGFWVIKSIPPEWLAVDAKKWRVWCYADAHKQVLEDIEKSNQIKIVLVEEKISSDKKVA